MNHLTGVSVVIPTFNRNRLLIRCLQALEEQTQPHDHFEVIVCDDAAAPSTRTIVECMATIVPYTLRYLPITQSQGPAAARNRGWEVARYEAIAFTDDDTIPEQEWLAEGSRALQGALAVAGRVIVPLSTSPTDYEKNEAGLQRTEFVTANCFVRRSVLRHLNGFDERFTAAWREDSDLHFRILSMTQSPSLRNVVRCESARVRHPIRPARWGVSVLQQRKSVFNALLRAKHPTLFQQRIESGPPLGYYLSSLSGCVALCGVYLGSGGIAGVAGGLWLGSTGRFCWRRLSGTSRRFSHVAEMALTSIIIPPVAIFWRLLGAWRYRVPYL
jgi:GT2 family glycosyltransferase